VGAVAFGDGDGDGECEFAFGVTAVTDLDHAPVVDHGDGVQVDGADGLAVVVGVGGEVVEVRC